MRYLHTICIFLCFQSASAQPQISLQGEATRFNSKYLRHKLEYVPNASVSANNATMAITDVYGRFQLIFVGVEAGRTVNIKAEAPRLSLVNAHDLKNVVLGRTSLLRIYFAPPDE